MFAWATPYLLYIKLALVLSLCAGSAWAAYEVRDAQATKAEAKAVNAAIEQAQADLKEERKWRAHYQELADSKLDLLLKSISNIKIEHTTITKNITTEREVNKEFYGQPLPDRGYEQWKKARSLALPASSPVP